MPVFLPEKIKIHLPDSERIQDSLGCSQANVYLFADRVLKIEQDCNNSANECRMMHWLQGRLPVPRVIADDLSGGMRYLMMSRMQGEVLCSPSILDDQAGLAELVAQGLRMLWSVDVSGCPTDRSLNQKFREIEMGLRMGTITRDTANQPETYGSEGFETPAQLFDWLVKNRPAEELVLSHGDCCLPNIFTMNGRVSGFIDLGQAGVADKWVDIEQVLWSIWANTTGIFGGKTRDFDRKYLFEALGMQPDEDRLRYYSLLSELC